jgi:hypothetical protein
MENTTRRENNFVLKRKRNETSEIKDSSSSTNESEIFFEQRLMCSEVVWFGKKKCISKLGPPMKFLQAPPLVPIVIPNVD